MLWRGILLSGEIRVDCLALMTIGMFGGEWWSLASSWTPSLLWKSGIMASCCWGLRSGSDPQAYIQNWGKIAKWHHSQGFRIVIRNLDLNNGENLVKDLKKQLVKPAGWGGSGGLGQNPTSVLWQDSEKLHKRTNATKFQMGVNFWLSGNVMMKNCNTKTERRFSPFTFLK